MKYTLKNLVARLEDNSAILIVAGAFVAVVLIMLASILSVNDWQF